MRGYLTIKKKKKKKKKYHLPAASSWGKGHAMTQEEAESWFNVCEERLRSTSIAATGEAH